MRPDLPRRFLTALVISSATAACAAEPPPQSPPGLFETRFDEALKRHVHQGLVDYTGLKTDADFSAAVNALARTDPDALAGRPERLAFWINAYNALVIKGVVDNYPIGSVTEVGLLGRWSFFKLIEFVVGGKGRTLDQIEHGIIRPGFDEPRAHFALVCASLGCPTLRAGVWRADLIETQLEEAARAFINDPSRVQVVPGRGVLRLSKIFDWYREDFEKSAGTVTAFLGRYRAEGPIPPGMTIEYIEYSWSLNDWKPGPGRGRAGAAVIDSGT